MYKKTITYTDYDGNERVEDFYFHLNKAELVELEFCEFGSTSRLLEKIINTSDMKQLIKIFKTIIAKSYGEKSLDGKRFIKSEEAFEAFKQTEAYPALFIELASDADAGAEFINGIMPADLREALANKQGVDPELAEKFKQLQERNKKSE